jgi:hypothetical protein
MRNFLNVPEVPIPAGEPPRITEQRSNCAMAVVAAHSLLMLAKHSYAGTLSDDRVPVMLTDAIGLLWTISNRLMAQPLDDEAREAIDGKNRDAFASLAVVQRSMREAGLLDDRGAIIAASRAPAPREPWTRETCTAYEPTTAAEQDRARRQGFIG